MTTDKITITIDYHENSFYFNSHAEIMEIITSAVNKIHQNKAIKNTRIQTS